MSRNGIVVLLAGAVLVSVITTTLSLASTGQPKPPPAPVSLTHRVDELEKSVRDLQERVAVLEGKTAEEKAGEPQKRKVDDPFGACRDWGKDNKYVNQTTSDYRVIKNAGLSESEILRSALDACAERTSDRHELRKCRACMTAIVSELFKE